MRRDWTQVIRMIVRAFTPWALLPDPCHTFYWPCVRWRRKSPWNRICLWRAFRSYPYHLDFILLLLPMRMAMYCDAHGGQRTTRILFFHHGFQGWIQVAQQTFWLRQLAGSILRSFSSLTTPAEFWELLTFFHSRISACPRFIPCPHLKQAGSRNSKDL